MPVNPATIRHSSYEKWFSSPMGKVIIQLGGPKKQFTTVFKLKEHCKLENSRRQDYRIAHSPTVFQKERKNKQKQV